MNAMPALFCGAVLYAMFTATLNGHWLYALFTYVGTGTIIWGCAGYFHKMRLKWWKVAFLWMPFMVSKKVKDYVSGDF